MKKIKLLIIISLPILLTGCYNYQELNDMALTAAIGIDKDEDGYIFTAQIINTQNSKDTNINASQVTVYSASGKTVQEAARSILLQSPKRLFIEHLDIMVISEEVAKDGIKNILDVFLRDAESRNQYDVLISRDCTAQELLSILTPLETISSSNIKDSLKANSNHLGSTAMVKMEQMLNTYLNDKIEIAIPSITLQGDPNEGDKNENIEESNSTAKVILSNTAIFKKDKLVGYLTQEEDIAANFIKNNINNTLITYKCDDKNYATVEIIKSSAKITTDQNKLKLNIKIKGTGNLNEMNCQVNLEKEQTIHTIEKEVEKTLKQMLEKVIKKTRETYKSDIFGFEDIIYKNNNKLYNKVKDDWDNKYFYDLKIDIDTDIDIIEKGQILRVISNE